MTFRHTMGLVILACGMMTYNNCAQGHSLKGKPIAEQISLVPGSGIQMREMPMLDATGKNAVFPKIAAGKWSVVYFGFTSCKSACPMTASYIRAEMSEWQNQVRPQVFLITVDPDEDKPEVLKRWLAQFDESWMGLTGNKLQIDEVAKVFGVTHEPTNTKGAIKKSALSPADSAKEKVLHSSYVYLVDPQGIWKAYVPTPAKKGVLRKGLLDLGFDPKSRQVIGK